jgi:hypothetical protein
MYGTGGEVPESAAEVVRFEDWRMCRDQLLEGTERSSRTPKTVSLIWRLISRIPKRVPQRHLG